MTEKEKYIANEVNKTLKALDDQPNLKPNLFLFTRIQANISSELVSKKRISLRPIALCLIIILNIITAIYFFNSGSRDYTKSQIISSLSKDYNTEQNDF